MSDHSVVEYGLCFAVFARIGLIYIYICLLAFIAYGKESMIEMYFGDVRVQCASITECD